MLNKHLRTTYKNKSNNSLIFSTGKKGNAFFLISWNKFDEKDTSTLDVQSLLCKFATQNCICSCLKKK